MKARFHDRRKAGIELADRFDKYLGRKDLLILALPRGGVPVAAELAVRLHAPLDIMLVRKLGAPGHEELALGAIASGGFRVMNADVLQSLEVNAGIWDEILARETRELESRERSYREGLPVRDLKNKVIILVDDGIATGATMRVAIQAARAHEAARIIAASPVASPITVRELENDADEVMTVFTPWNLCSIGQWYENFDQLTDTEVRDLLYPLARSPQRA